MFAIVNLLFYEVGQNFVGHSAQRYFCSRVVLQESESKCFNTLLQSILFHRSFGYRHKSARLYTAGELLHYSNIIVLYYYYVMFSKMKKLPLS